MDSDDTSIFEEKRRFKRFPASVEVKFRVLHVSDAPKLSAAGKLRDGKTKDVSTAGLFVVTTQAPEEGQLLEVSFGLPNSRVVQILGRTSWISKDSKDPGFGVEMFKTTQEEFDEIVRRSKRGEWITADSDEKGES